MKEYNVPILIYNDDELEEWELVLNNNDFSISWEDNEFDMDMNEVYSNNMFDLIKWTPESSKVMVIGLFTKGI